MSFYGRVVALIHDPFLALGERAGMREMRRPSRRWLHGSARGRPREGGSNKLSRECLTCHGTRVLRSRWTLASLVLPDVWCGVVFGLSSRGYDPQHFARLPRSS